MKSQKKIKALKQNDISKKMKSQKKNGKKFFKTQKFQNAINVTFRQC